MKRWVACDRCSCRIPLTEAEACPNPLCLYEELCSGCYQHECMRAEEMLPQLKALANTVRSRTSPPPAGVEADDHDPVRNEMDAALGSLPEQDVAAVVDFSVAFLEAVKRRADALAGT